MTNSNKTYPNYKKSKLLGILGFVSIIAVVLYSGISTYLPYFKHKPLISLKTKLIKMAGAENKYFKKNKKFATVKELFSFDGDTIFLNNYKVTIDVKPDLSSYVITAKQQDESNLYPNCDKLVVTPKKYFSYDTFGEISTGCW